MTENIEKVLLSAQQLQAKIAELGAKISEDYRGKKLLMVSVLKGSVVFMADLMRSVTVPCEIDFMSVKSYGDDTKSSGEVRITKDLDRPIEGYDLLIVEDILDSGRTLSYLRQVLSARHPASIRLCTLLDKPDRREAMDVAADYVGFTIPDAFVVGYGLDYAEKYRNLPYVGIVDPDKE